MKKPIKHRYLVNAPHLPKQYIRVKERIFHRVIHVFLNYSSKEFESYVVKRWKACLDGKSRPEFDDNFSAFSSEWDDEKGVRGWIICIKDFDWSIRDQGTLIHEIVHTIVKIWAFNNIPYGKDTQEFLAHSVANLYEDIAYKIRNPHRYKKGRG